MEVDSSADSAALRAALLSLPPSTYCGAGAPPTESQRSCWAASEDGLGCPEEEEEVEAELEPVPESEEPQLQDVAMAEAEPLPAPAPAPPAKVVQAMHVDVLPSVFSNRPPTILFEMPPGLPPRSLTATPKRGSTEGAPQPVRVPLDGLSPRAVCMRIEKNANAVRHAFKRAGFTVNPSSESARPLVCWARHSGDRLWKELPLGSIVNHFPGSWTLGRKDGLARIMAEQQRRCGHEYNFVPRTFTLPADRGALERAHAEGTLMGGRGCAFIVKPLNSSRGRG